MLLMDTIQLQWLPSKCLLANTCRVNILIIPSAGTYVHTHTPYFIYHTQLCLYFHTTCNIATTAIHKVWSHSQMIIKHKGWES